MKAVHSTLILILMTLFVPAIGHSKACILYHNVNQEPVWSNQHSGGSGQYTGPSAWYIFNASTIAREFKVKVSKNQNSFTRRITLGSGDWKKFGNVNRITVPSSSLADNSDWRCKKWFGEDHWTWVDWSIAGTAGLVGAALLFMAPVPQTENGVPCSDYFGAAQQNCISGWQNRK